ncbi:MAG: MarR family winged helix-turn-helix transcriptional regulator [Acidimicrobiales bacterium]
MHPDPSSDVELRRRVGSAWRQVRRGASALQLKDVFYGDHSNETLDMALADALSVICQNGPLRMGELADALQITPASTTRAVSCLVDKGYVERVKAADDHRSILVSATPVGRDRMEIINSRVQAGLGQILNEFSVDEQVQLAELLERFVESVDRFVASQTTTGRGD